MSKILNQLIQSQHIERQVIARQLYDKMAELRRWQCKRLLISYDHLYQQEKYRDAMTFFSEELYGDNDFSQRDEEIKKVLPLMEKLLSQQTLTTFEIALRLNTLSYQLDLALLDQIPTTQSISRESYYNAYKNCNNLAERQKQIDYIELLAFNLADIARRKSIMLMLTLSRKPAKLAGLSELQRILEAGAKAFKKMGKVECFIQPVLNGERKLMQKIFEGDNQLPVI